MTDDDIKQLWHEVINQEPRTGIGHQISFARALLSRYGRQATPQEPLSSD